MGSLLHLIRNSSHSSSSKRSLALTVTVLKNQLFSTCSTAVSSTRSFRSAADYSDEKVYSGLDFLNLGISPHIVSALERKGLIYNLNFPIQTVLEPAMQGRDMMVRRAIRGTGTGKTLAFGIPIMDKIIRFNAKHGQGRDPLAIIMAPTMELARHVEKEFAESAPKLDTICVYRGAAISRQMTTLDRGVDVIVGTPGRVIDLIKAGSLNLTKVQFVVLDEADQMLNVGFADDVETILGYITQKHQTIMFSATMPNWIVKLTHKFLKSPVTIDLPCELAKHGTRLVVPDPDPDPDPRSNCLH